MTRQILILLFALVVAAAVILFALEDRIVLALGSAGILGFLTRLLIGRGTPKGPGAEGARLALEKAEKADQQHRETVKTVQANLDAQLARDPVERANARGKPR